jgi:RimJ/RimL family protein N-acetyltransferase
VTHLRGERIVLRGYRPDEIDAALVRSAESARRYGAGREFDAERRRERLERSGARTAWEIMFAIDLDGRIVGDVQGRCSDQAMPPGVWEIGIEIDDETLRGKGIGREAVSLITGHLFEGEDAHRVQATTDVDNTAMRRVLEVLGYTDEGTLRGFMPRSDGPPRDYEMYAITFDDWMRKH